MSAPRPAAGVLFRECTMRYSPEAAAVVDALYRAGFAAFFVGGCVRDRLFGLPCADIDVATNAPLSAISLVFPGARIVGEAFSVALVGSIEVATFRRDGPYSDFRHPDFVELVSTIEEDLARRDFTINAMAEDRDGRLVDPHGGQADLKARRIRFVGDPDARLREDPIRAVRSCRFAGLIGGTIEPATAAAIAAGCSLLGHVPRERIQLELNKLLLVADRARALDCLRQLGLLPLILPRLARSIGVSQNFHHAEDCWDHAVASVQAVKKRNINLRLSVLLHDIAKPATHVRGPDGADHFYRHDLEGVDTAGDELHDLRYSTDTIEYVKEAVRHHMTKLMFAPEMKDATIRRLMSALQHMPVRDLLRLQVADLRGNARQPFTGAEIRAHLRHALSRIRTIERAAHALHITDLAISGGDVMRTLGIPAGPAVGAALRHCLDQVLLNPALNDRDRLLDLVRALGTTAT